MEQNWEKLNRSTGEDHIFCIGDVHGELESLDAVLDKIAALSKHGSSKIVFLGDLIDRGPAPMTCLQRVWQARERTGVDQTILLPGNHELMMIAALGHHPDAATRSATQQLWMMNGGVSAFEELEEKGYSLKSEDDFIASLHAEFPDDLIDVLNERSHHREGDLLFVHAGIHPHIDTEDFLAMGHHEHKNWAWIRAEFLDHVKGWDEDRRQIVVHGHTPWEQDSGSPMAGVMSERIRAWRAGESIGMDSTFQDAQGADLVESRQRINLDSGCGKFTKTLPFAEFWDGSYRIHAVTPQAVH